MLLADAKTGRFIFIISTRTNEHLFYAQTELIASKCSKAAPTMSYKIDALHFITNMQWPSENFFF